jgi:hypothetical protein
MKAIQKGYVYYVKYDFDDKPHLAWHSSNTMGNHTAEWVLVGPQDIEISCPDDFDPRPAQVAALDEQIAKTRAEFTARINELQDQKNKLLCLELSA